MIKVLNIRSNPTVSTYNHQTKGIPNESTTYGICGSLSNKSLVTLSVSDFMKDGIYIEIKLRFKNLIFKFLFCEIFSNFQ